MSSAKGHEFFLKHYLGTQTNAIAEEITGEDIHEAVWREQAPEGKLDLVVNINSRMDTTALYSDIVLPTATFYENNDLNSTDMHSYIHPLTQKSPRQPASAVLKSKKAAFYRAFAIERYTFSSLK
jgi:nitrate reductase alpha subunit